jgi:hypothetical protein
MHNASFFSLLYHATDVLPCQPQIPRKTDTDIASKSSLFPENIIQMTVLLPDNYAELSLFPELSAHFIPPFRYGHLTISFNYLIVFL